MRILNILSYIAVLLLINYSQLFAQQHWNAVEGPYGGPVYSIFKGAATDYCITPAGVFRSTDSGIRWNQSTSLNMKNLYVGASASNGYIYAATTNYTTLLYRSTDNGISWQQRLDGGLNFNALEVGQNGTIFAGTFYMFSFHGQFIQDGNIYRSTDNGNSFAQMNFPPLAVSSLKISPSGKIFVATTEGLFVSVNNGAGFGLSRPGSVSRIFAASNGFIFLHASGNTVIRSTDEGNSWNVLASGDESKFPISEDPAGNIYSDHLGKLYKSTDHGTTWSLFADITGGSFSEITSVAFRSPGKILVSTSNGIYRSDDSGVTWSYSSDGLRDPQVQIITVRNNTIFTGSYNNASRSLDNGNHWELMTNGLPEGYVRNIVPVGSDNVFAEIAVRGLFLSEDNGNNWTRVNTLPVSTSITDIVSRNNELWITTGNGELLMSGNLGKTWINKNSDLPDSIQFMSLFVTDEGDIIVSVEKSSWFDPLKGIYRSSDNGASWMEINGEFSPDEMHLSGNNIMIARSASTLFRSSNGGMNFSILTTPQEYVTGYAVSPDGVIIMQVAVNEEYFIRKSYDNGNSWTDITGILDEQLVYDINFDINNRILLATQSGVYRSDDPTLITNNEPGIPSDFLLSQNYPNPFNPVTNINFRIAQAGKVLIRVFDVSGREVSTIVDDNFAIGDYSITFDGSILPSGSYFYSMSVNSKVFSTKKMILLK